jgi:hypothetical protein
MRLCSADLLDTSGQPATPTWSVLAMGLVAGEIFSRSVGRIQQALHSLVLHPVVAHDRDADPSSGAIAVWTPVQPGE